MTCSIPEAGWAFSAPSWSAGRVSRRSTRRPLICTSGFSPGNPGWGDPPLEDEVRMTSEALGLAAYPRSLFGPTVTRWYPAVQRFNGDGFADLLRTTSLYRALDSDIRDPLLAAIAGRIRTRMSDRASRRYLSVLRVGQRAG